MKKQSLKLNFDGKLILILISFIYILIWLAILYLILMNKKDYSLLSLCTTLSAILLSAFCIYKILVLLVVGNIINKYFTLADDIIKDDKISLLDISSRFEKLNNYTNFFKSIFSEYDSNIIEFSRTTVINRKEKRFGGFRNL